MVAWAGRKRCVGSQNRAGNVRVGTTVLHQGTDKDCFALGAVASRPLTDVLEVFWGDTAALPQQRALPWLGVLAARQGAGSGAALLSTGVGPDRPMTLFQKPWLARQEAGSWEGVPGAFCYPGMGSVVSWLESSMLPFVSLQFAVGGRDWLAWSLGRDPE